MIEAATAKKWAGDGAFKREWDGFAPKGEGGRTYATVRHKANEGGRPTTRHEIGTASNDEGRPLGDIRAGRHFAKATRNKLRFVEPAGRWLKWNGTIWEWCNRGEEMQAAKRVADAIIDHVMTLYKADPERHRKALTWASGLQNIKRLEAMVELAKSEEV